TAPAGTITPGFGASCPEPRGRQTRWARSTDRPTASQQQSPEFRKMTKAKRPPIHMIDSEADALADMAYSAKDRLPQASELLVTEIERAKIYSVDRIPADVVTMGSTVEYVDEASGAIRTVQLVYP